MAAREVRAISAIPGVIPPAHPCICEERRLTLSRVQFGRHHDDNQRIGARNFAIAAIDSSNLSPINIANSINTQFSL
jgi:hypothetical protein